MSHRVISGGLIVFVALTLALVVNLINLQSGTRELAPAPRPALTAVAKAPEGASKDGGLVILNAHGGDQTALEVQRELTALGYRPGPIDGSVRLMTKAAVMAYEYDNGLPLTGVADTRQLERLLLGLGNYTSAGSGRAGLPVTDEAKRVMQTVQQSLKQLSYDPGAVDGTFTAETERAIRNFEIDTNLPETGRVSGRLIDGLSNLALRDELKLTRR